MKALLRDREVLNKCRVRIMMFSLVLSVKDKKTVEVDDGVAPNGDKESQCSSSDLQTSSSHQHRGDDSSSSATQPTSATQANTSSSPSTDNPASGPSFDS